MLSPSPPASRFGHTVFTCWGVTVARIVGHRGGLGRQLADQVQ
jgi:hypothetical protein